MGLKAKIEAIIYAAEEPITLEQITLLVQDIVIAEQAAADASAAEALASEPNALEIPTDEIREADVTELLTPELSPEEPVAEISDEATVPETIDLSAADTADSLPAESASVTAPEPTHGKRKKADVPKKELSEDAKVRLRVRTVIEELVADYDREERGMEIRRIAGGYRMGTKPEHHDLVRAFAKSLKPPIRLSLAALETLAVVAYKQPITVPEISEIRGVESAGVIGTLLDRKLINTAGRKQVIGRPILYKTSKEFLMRFGLNELAELPSMEEFEKLGTEGQGDLFAEAKGSEPAPAPDADATIESGEEPEAQPAEEVVAPQAEYEAPDSAVGDSIEEASVAKPE